MRKSWWLVPSLLLVLMVLAACQQQTAATENQQATEQEKKSAKKQEESAEQNGKKYVGVIAAVEEDSIKVEKKDQEGNVSAKTFTLTPETNILLGSKTVDKDKLKPGMKVIINFQKDGDTLVALKVEAKKNKPPEGEEKKEKPKKENEKPPDQDAN